MELQEFIASTLTSIAKGIETANERLQGSAAIVNPPGVFVTDKSSSSYGTYRSDLGAHPPVHLVHFDVAVVASEGEEASGGFGIAIAAVAFGARDRHEEKQAQHSRISFGIPLLLPPGERPEDFPT